MNINIYQIDTSRDRKRICFFGLDEIKELTGEDTLNSGIYDKIFSGDVDCNNLEAVYRMFNTDHPAGYTGRSLSVSDVVEITDGDKKGFYFCDNIGFQKIDFDSSLCKDLTTTEKLSVLLISPAKLREWSGFLILLTRCRSLSAAISRNICRSMMKSPLS